MAQVEHRRVDPSALVVVWASLVSIGLVMVASASVSLDRPVLSENVWTTPLGRQVIFAAIGFGLMALTAKVSVKALSSAGIRKAACWTLYGVSVALLVAALIPGLADPHRGSHRWLRVGGLGLDIGLQPSELAKLALVGTLAWFFGERPHHARTFWRGFVPAALSAGVVVGLVGKENLGTAALLACVTGAMLLVGGCRMIHFLPAALGGAGGLVGLVYAASYRMERLQAFGNYWDDPMGKGYQPIQSLTAIATGGWFGTGLGAGTQKFGYLPESHTDFVFAILCEETGIVGAGLVIALFCAFGWLGLRVMLSARSPFERMLAFGLTLVVILQALVNLAVVTVLMPTTGVPLPMISAGGSGLLTVSVGVGVLAAIAYRGQHGVVHRLEPAGPAWT